MKVDVTAFRDRNGAFLDKLNDLAIQYPLFEMSGPDHIQYIPEVVYFYNEDYEENDNWKK